MNSVLIVTPIFPPQTRGPATYTYELTKRLTEQKIRCTVVTFTQNPWAVDNCNVVSISTKGNIFTRQWTLFKTVLFYAGQADVIYGQGADVVGFICVIVGRLVKKKVVLKVVGDLDIEMERDFKKKIWYLPLIIKTTLNLADKIIFPAVHLGNQIISKYKFDNSKIEIVYNAVGVEKVLSKKQIDKKIHLISPLSNLHPVKNIPGIIEALTYLDQKYVLDIVGGGDNAQFRILAKKLNLSKRVKFWGELQNTQAKSLLSQSDVFILNSFHEGMPHAMIEALALKVPVVVTRIPAFLEVIDDGKNGTIVDVNNPKSLSEGVALAIKNRQKLVEKGYRLYQKKFTWEVHLMRLLDIFN